MTALEKIRNEAKVSQTAVAQHAGISVSAYCQYETGRRSVPAKTAHAIADYFSCQVGDLFLPIKFTVSKL